METLLRAALLDWLTGDPAISGSLNSITEEAPVSASAPWLGIAASASTDWGSKTEPGREVRIALELHTRGDDPAGDGALVRQIDKRVQALPRMQAGFAVITARFLRARAEHRARNLLSVLLEYRFRVLTS
ncbi:MAG: DUF3168 domain-containing protein [Alteripontixanthobacter sp.]